MSKLMKGHTFAKGKHRMTYPAVAEVKVDEIRLDAQVYSDGDVTFLSYAGKPLHNLYGQFAEAFRQSVLNLADMGEDYDRFDLGVLVGKTFDNTYRYVRSSKGVPSDLLGLPIEFIVFDMPQSDADFKHRMNLRTRVVEAMRAAGLQAFHPEYKVVESEAEVLPLYEAVRNGGMEGLMLKSFDHKYETDKRSYGWLKVKPEDEADGKIVVINRAFSLEGVPLDRAGSVEVECEDGSTANVPGIPHDLGRLMLAHPEQFIGQWLVFDFMERDRQGGYRHPRLNRLREAKQ